MATSIKQFHEELYVEHIEEGSFLYDQQLAYLADPELSWRDLDDLQQRYEAHIDALVVGAQLALQVCQEKAGEADAGELSTIVRVYCRQHQKELLFKILNQLEGAEPELKQAVAIALRNEAPPAWKDDLLRVLQGKQVHLDAVLGPVAGYRRFQAGSILLAKLGASKCEAHAHIIWALGRTGDQNAVPVLREYLEHEDSAICEQAAFALLRLGDDRPIRNGLLAAHLHNWPRRCLAVAGNEQSVSVMLDVLKGEKANTDCVQALGLLGDLRAVAPLVGKLDDDDLGECAAIALNTITGANLFAETFIADEFDEDELFDDEREAYQKEGKLPTRDNDEPYGSREVRPSRSVDDWRNWLGANKNKFDRERRWRMGEPYGPKALVACLMDDSASSVTRAATYDELVCRYLLTVPFEVDLPVSQQDQFLKKIASWANEVENSYVAGGWYFAGRVQK